MTRLVYKDIVELIFKGIIELPRLKELSEDFRKHRFESWEHSIRVGQLSLDLALEKALQHKYANAHLDSVIEEALQHSYIGSNILNIGIGAVFHDIGKMTTPTKIIEKNGPLTEEEETIMGEHVWQSYLILQQAGYTFAAELALRHHDYKRKRRFSIIEKPDLGEQVNKIVKLIAAADVFDALSHGRPGRTYKEAMSLDQIKVIMPEEYSGDQEFIDAVLRRA